MLWKAIGDAKSTKATVTDAELPFPSTVAVIVVVPATRPVTIPVADTVAMLWSPLDQVTGRPKSRAPAALLTATPSCAVSLPSTVAVAGVTATDATATPRTARQLPLTEPEKQESAPESEVGGSPETVAPY